MSPMWWLPMERDRTKTTSPSCQHENLNNMKAPECAQLHIMQTHIQYQEKIYLQNITFPRDIKKQKLNYDSTYIYEYHEYESACS